MSKVIVLSSGGIDSTTCISLAIKDYGRENVMSASIYYGQKHSKELECARKIAEHYGIEHREIDISKVGIFDNSQCTLLQNSTKEISHESYSDQIENAENGMVDTYVPFRNGLMLSLMASLALSEFPHETVYIYLGAHADDSAGSAYADCSPQFAFAMYEAINIGSYNQVHVCAPFINYTKKDVVSKGLELDTPYELTWSCYEGGDKPCGTCGTCRDRAAAFAHNGVQDPALQ